MNEIIYLNEENKNYLNDMGDMDPCVHWEAGRQA
jgi:hypothetical protein